MGGAGDAYYGTEPDHRTNPVWWVRWTKQRYRAALPIEDHKNTTISPAVLRLPNGELVKRVSVNGFSHALPESIEEIRGDAEVANDGFKENGDPINQQPINKHAEIRMKEYAEREGMSIVAIGATNNVCDSCRDALDAVSIPIVTGIVNPDVRPYWRPPEGVKLPDRSYLPPGLREAREDQDARAARARAEESLNQNAPPSEPWKRRKPPPPATPRPPRIDPSDQPPNQGRKHGPRR